MTRGERPELPAGLVLPPPLWEAALAAYAAPERRYHDVAHLGEVLGRFGEVARDLGWPHPREVLLALVFHDVIYEPGRRDNELRSAAVARDALARWLPGARLDAARIERLITLTARHGSLGPGDVDPEEALFLDCDMAILGSPPDAFDAYDRRIAEEYAAVPRDRYVAGRRRFLERLLAADRIFLSPYFHARLDTPARANLGRALAGGAGS